MRNNINEIIAKISENPVENVQSDSRLEEDLNMDSLMIIDLALKMEELIGIKLSPEVISKLILVSDVYCLAEKKDF